MTDDFLDDAQRKLNLPDELVALLREPASRLKQEWRAVDEKTGEVIFTYDSEPLWNDFPTGGVRFETRRVTPWREVAPVRTWGVTVPVPAEYQHLPVYPRDPHATGLIHEEPE